MRPFLFALAVTAGLGALSVPAAAAPVIGLYGPTTVEDSSLYFVQKEEAIGASQVTRAVSAALEALVCMYYHDTIGALGGLRGAHAASYDASDFSDFDR